MVIPPSHMINSGSFHVNTMCLSVITLKVGNANQTRVMAMNSETKAVSIDSVMNWKISECRCAPMDFFIPTSFALRDARAVERFMKLIQAINKMKMAIMENKRTYSMRPPESLPFS